MSEEEEAEALGRRFDHVARARWSLCVLHFSLGALAWFLVNIALRVQMWDDWWFRPLRLAHLAWARFSFASLILWTCLLAPPAIYFVSWSKIKDTVLEGTFGAAFWITGGIYVLLFAAVSLVSDWLSLVAIKPPLSLLSLAAVWAGTLAMLLVLAELTDGIAQRLSSNQGLERP